MGTVAGRSAILSVGLIGKCSGSPPSANLCVVAVSKIECTGWPKYALKKGKKVIELLYTISPIME